MRYLGYDYEQKHGFKLGRLSGITLGQGLLVDNFNTGSGGSTELKQRKMGVLAYTTLFETKITALHSFENVQAIRIQRPTLTALNTPIIVGGTFAQDTDGINDTSMTTPVLRPKQTGYAIDVSYPIGGEFLNLYTEYANLENQGEGVSAGFKGNILSVASYKAAYRNLGKGFVPGYFNSTYQASSFDFTTDALQKRTTGFLVNATAGLMDGYVKAGAQYEKYGDINVVSAAAGWKRVGPVSGVVNITKPFISTL